MLPMMPADFTSRAMTAAGFTDLLGRYLAKFQHCAHQLTEARLLARPTAALEADLQRYLLAYTWSVQSRALLRDQQAAPAPQQTLEVHLRLSVVELLVALRAGQYLEPQPAPAPSDPDPSPPLLQRLAAAESRLFHLYGAAPLN